MLPCLISYLPFCHHFLLFLLKETIRPYQLGCVIVAFVGALFILRPGFDNVATFPAFLGLIGGMGAGLAYTNVRLAAKHGAPGPLIVFCFSVFPVSVRFRLLFLTMRRSPGGSWHPF